LPEAFHWGSGSKTRRHRGMVKAGLYSRRRLKHGLDEYAAARQKYEKPRPV
jgi:hypothetical protein